MEWRIQRYPILASTNDLALGLMRAGAAAAGDVWVAAEQTAGRGRRGRSWHSTRGALMLTAALPFYPERAGWTALAAGCAVALAVRDFGAPAGVKWPNDVVLDDRKLAGVLVESCVPDLVAVGIGLNVANSLPPDQELLRPAARLIDHPSLGSEGAVFQRGSVGVWGCGGVGPAAGDRTPLRGTLAEDGPDQQERLIEVALAAVLERLAEQWERLADGDLDALRRTWEALDTTRGRRVRWSEAGEPGTALDVTETGALRLTLDDGRRVEAAVGEVDFL